jgi:Transcriptional regulator, AbiEi antitoxin
VATKVRTVEERLARIAGRQHGNVTREQLLRAGVTPAEIHERVRRGALLREYRGVYRVGQRAESLEASYMAAVLACGAGAALSGLAAAYVLGLVRGKPPGPEVTAPSERRIAGIRTRRARGGLAAGERVTRRGMTAKRASRSASSSAASCSY